MRKGNLITALVAGGLALATTNLMAQGTEQASPAMNQPPAGHQGQYSKNTPPGGATFGASDLKASSLIGLPVRNESGERLGRVQDLVISMKSRSVPIAIVEYGGALGIGETRVAVPLRDLQWSSDTKDLTLMTTKEQFDSASTIPTGGWTALAGEDCLKNVDRFYGQLSMTGESRYERQEATGMGEGRESVRNPAERKGATALMDEPPAISPGATNNDSALQRDYVVDKVNAVIRQNLGANAGNIQVTVKNGHVILQGKAASEAQAQTIVNQVKAVPGVNQVENHLTTPE
jgi:osmotically-inducible protein OsmY/sporulation protein YlmC with PRC-barrel domain